MSVNPRKALKFLYYQFYTPFQRKLMNAGLSPSEITRGTHEAHIKRLNLTLKLPEQGFFLDRLKFAFELAAIGGKFAQQNNGIHFALGDYHTALHTAQDLFILREIFCAGIYNFEIEGSVVVCDIGMNVGMASIYFAHRDNVKTVHSFEPFPRTYEDALANIALNPKIAAKIKPHCYGVAAESKEIQTGYAYDNKASMSLIGASSAATSETLTVRVEAIETIFDTIGDDLLPSDRLVFKIDCEGAEYEIIDRLGEKGLLGKIAGMMIEWHIKGPDSIVTILKNHGYLTISLDPYSAKYGTIYAYNLTLKDSKAIGKP